MQKITLTSSNRRCDNPNAFLGYEGENEANKLVFEFTDGFRDGLGVLNLKRGEEIGYVSLDKVGNTYEFPVKNAILTEAGEIKFQVVITGNDGSVIKYDPFVMSVKDAIDADTEMPEDYPSWVDMANAKLAEVDQAITNAETVSNQLLEDKANGVFDGKDGATGPQGPRGEQGVRGERGERGPQGETGATGPQGPRGETGAQGLTGPQGPQGPAGADGTISFEELTEEQKASLRGEAGPQGPQGIQGERGPKGDTGAAGPQGPAGATGPQGPKGDKGDKGDTGNTGPQGPAGETGPAGANGITPHIGTNNNWWIGDTDTGIRATPNIVTLTQSEYDALVSAGTIDENAYYFIKEG